MASKRLPSLASHLRKVERYVGPTQRLGFGLDGQLWGILQRKRRMSARTLVNGIDTLCRLAPYRPDLWRCVEDLVTRAVREYPDIPLEKKVAWVSELSKAREHLAVQRILSWLIHNGDHVDPKIVMQWVENAMSWSDMKQGALMLLVGDRRYMKFTVLPTWQILDYLERTSDRYDGNHAVFRFFGIMALRMQKMRRSARLYPACVEMLARVLYRVGKHDESDYDTLARWIPRLGPETAKEVQELFVAYVQEEINLLESAKARSSNLPEPAA